jgi:hypothetical protein
VPTDDDTPDPADEWSDPDPTISTGAPLVIPSEEVTRPNDLGPVLEEARLRGRDEGCKACYEEGQDDALIGVRAFLISEGATEERIEVVLAGARQRFTKL